MSMTVVPLGAELVLRRNPLRPGDDHAVAGAAVVAGDLLGPLERGTHRVRPADRVVVERLPRPDIVAPLQQLLEVFLYAVEERHLVEKPLQAPFGARPVVAGDVDDERVVELTQLLDRLQHAADVVVGLLQEPGVHLHHAGKESLLLGGKGVPRLHAGGAGRELRVSRYDTQLLLPREYLLADFVPALVELPLVLLDPLLLRVVRGVRGARGVVDEERLVRRHGLLHLDPMRCLVGQVVVEVVIRVADVRVDRLGAFDDRRAPLVRVAADEAIEMVESEARRPAVERSGLAALPVRDVVILAEPRGAVSSLLENLRDRCGLFAHHRVVTGEAGARLHDDPGVRRMVVAAGEERRPCRAAQGRSMELVVPQPIVGELLERRRVDRSAERAGGAVTDVVEQHQQNVRRALGCLDRLREIGLRVLRPQVDRALERLGRVRQDRRAALLRCGRQRECCDQDREDKESCGLHHDGSPRRFLLALERLLADLTDAASCFAWHLIDERGLHRVDLLDGLRRTPHEQRERQLVGCYIDDAEAILLRWLERLFHPYQLRGR